jgi:hypothetical protein
MATWEDVIDGHTRELKTWAQIREEWGFKGSAQKAKQEYEHLRPRMQLRHLLLLAATPIPILRATSPDQQPSTPPTTPPAPPNQPAAPPPALVKHQPAEAVIVLPPAPHRLKVHPSNATGSILLRGTPGSSGEVCALVRHSDSQRTLSCGIFRV